MGPPGAACRSAVDEPSRDRSCSCRQACVDREAAAPPGASPRPRSARRERGRGADPSAAARLGAGRGGGRAHRCLLPADPDRSSTGPCGARAPGGARFPSIGGWCWRRSTWSTTWSFTSFATCGSRITHACSGRSSSGTARTGAINAPGCASTGPSSSRSNRRTDALKPLAAEFDDLREVAHVGQEDGHLCHVAQTRVAQEVSDPHSLRDPVGLVGVRFRADGLDVHVVRRSRP